MKFIVLAIICISTIYVVSAAVKGQHKILKFPGQELISSYQSFKDGNLTYLVCQSNTAINRKSCQVIRQRPFFSNLTSTCSVVINLTSQQGKDKINKEAHIKVVPIEGNKAVLYRIVGETNAAVQIYTIELDTCKTTAIPIVIKNPESPIRDLIIVSYDNSYDVFYPAAYDRYDKISMGSKGEKIEGPVNAINSALWLWHQPRILPVSSKTPDKGFIFLNCIDDSNNDFDLMISKPGGSSTSLGRYKVFRSSVKSTTHDLIGICFIKDESELLYRCVQYKADGKLKFRSEPVTTNNRSEILIARNLRGGGFLLLAGECRDADNDCPYEKMRIFAVKVNSVGKMMGTINLQKVKFESRDNVTISIYENKNKEYCTSMAEFRNMPNDDSTIEIITQCFKDSDFIKKRTFNDDCG